MLRFIKQLILYFLIAVVRLAKRERLLEVLVPNSKKREISLPEVPEVPSILDEVTVVSDEWVTGISFVGFDAQGTCIQFKAVRNPSGLTTLEAKFDLANHGYFRHRESIQCTKAGAETVEPLFEAKRLQIFCLEPMRRWKICFRGPLDSLNDNGSRMHANILLYWECLSDPYDHVMTPSCWHLAGTLSHLSWKTLMATSILDKAICYEQWGEIRGKVDLENHGRIDVRLKSVREKHCELANTNQTSMVCRQHFVQKESGLAFSQRALVLNNEMLYSGFVTFPIGDSHPTSLRKHKIYSGEDIEHLRFPQRIRTCGVAYKISKNLYKQCFNSLDSDVTFLKLSINDRMGFGIQILKRNDVILQEEHTLTAYVADKTDTETILTQGDTCVEHVIKLYDKDCTSTSLVGGKASQLSTLTKMGNINVPHGICITTNAFMKHVGDNISIVKAVETLNESLIRIDVDGLSKYCDEAVKIFKQIPVENELIAMIECELNEAFGKDVWRKLKFAVRSSAVTEDSAETSTAGQLETYLGIQGIDNIVCAVKDCWASTLSYRTVEYRRQNGQKLFDRMGVLVQEMVAADVSGVIFTADPSSGNESVFVINATYGLGEVLVSGEVSPDTITVKRGEQNDFQITNIANGTKETKLVIDGLHGIKTDDVTQIERNEVCMGDDTLYLICKTAAELESRLGSSLDIEWALSNGQLYVLQARPITTLVFESDDDLIHEFDSPVVSAKELVTTCNVQEMMPGAVSTLTGDLFTRASNRGAMYNILSRLGLKHPVHPLHMIFTESGLAFFNITPCVCNGINGPGGEKAKSAVEIPTIGHSVPEHDINDVKDFIGRSFSFRQLLMRMYREFVTLKKHDSKLFETLKEKADRFNVVKDAKTAEELYTNIDENLWMYFEMWKAYVFKAGDSASWSFIIMMIMKGEAEDVSLEIKADMALIVSDCQNVVSAQIPEAIQDLAEKIAKSNLKDEFLATPVADCDNYLKNCDDFGLRLAYMKFMEHHGHRGIRETDFIEKSWSQDPTTLLETIKSIVGQSVFERNSKPHKSPDEIVASLQTQTTGFQKWLFKRFFIQNAMDGVAGRELGKSCMIKVTSVFKQAYWRLADLMVQETRLPEPELLFFLTHREIGEILRTRSDRLVRLAKRRKRVFPERNKITYPKISFGLPRPIKTEDQKHDIQPSVTLQGMPVCRGKVEGKARVIKSLADTKDIKKGEVMICRFTDVGWTPYFPLIRGLVTEIGGLLSHGAVVARECGIPCIVSAPAATDLFNTGNHVLLDGEAGTITKIGQ